MVEMGAQPEGEAVTPTLIGRLQTRVFLIVVIGSIWTAIITPVLPGMGLLGETYAVTFAILGVVGVGGLLWELPYHAIQQFRWEKDWPTALGLLTAINEGLLAWFIVDLGFAPGIEAGGVPLPAFLIHFLTTWIVIFLFANGPLRVPALRHRYRGGRLV